MYGHFDNTNLKEKFKKKFENQKFHFFLECFKDFAFFLTFIIEQNIKGAKCQVRM